MRPIIFFLIPYVIGSLCLSAFPYLLLVILFIAICLRFKLPFFSLLLLFLAVGGVVAICSKASLSAKEESLEHWNGELIKVEGKVESAFLPRKYKSVWEPEKIMVSSQCRFRITAFCTLERTITVNQVVFLRITEKFSFYRGQHLQVTGQLFSIRKQLYLKARNSSGIENLNKPSWFVGVLLRYQNLLLQVLEDYFPPEQTALFRVLLFGEKGQEEEFLWFYRAGIAHLLAISGLHLFFLICFIEFFLKFFQIHERWILSIASLFVLVGLFFLVQFTPSMSRASGIFVLLFLGRILRRSVDSLNISAFVFLMLISWEPTLLFQAGFQLTFAAFFGILVVAPKMSALFFKEDPLQELLPVSFWKKLWLFYKKGVLFSISIQLITLPFLLYHFQQCHPFVSLFNPLLLIPFQFLLFGLFGLVFGGLFLPNVLLSGYCCVLKLFTNLFFQLTYGLASIPGSQVYLAERPLWCYGLSLFLLFFFLKKSWPLFWTSFFVFLLLFGFMGKPSPAITFVDVGQGNLTLMQKDGKVLLYDAGSLNPSCFNRVVQLFWKRGIRHIDQCIISHADADHYNLVKRLNRWFPIQEIVVSAKTRNQLSWFLKSLIEEGVSLRLVQQGEHLRLGAQFHYLVLLPAKENSFILSRNNASLVLKVWIGFAQITLTGDIEQSQIDQIKFKSNLTLLPHHGSKRNCLEGWTNMGLFQVVSCDYWFPHIFRENRLYTYRLGNIEFQESSEFPYLKRVESGNF